MVKMEISTECTTEKNLSPVANMATYDQVIVVNVAKRTESSESATQKWKIYFSFHMSLTYVAMATCVLCRMGTMLCNIHTHMYAHTQALTTGNYYAKLSFIIENNNNFFYRFIHTQCKKAHIQRDGERENLIM